MILDASLISVLRTEAESLPAGAKLPTVRDLMSRHGVGQAAVQEAIGVLRREGVLTAHVGRGTFVAPRSAVQTTPRTVLTLSHAGRSQRNDDIARELHEQLLAADHRSMVLTYGDVEQVIDLVRAAGPVDGYVLQPRSSRVPVSLLAALRKRTKAVVVEGVPLEADVDAVVTDWSACVDLAARHLHDLGHRRIALVAWPGTAVWSQVAARQMRAVGAWGAIDATVLAPPAGDASDDALREVVRRAAGEGRVTGWIVWSHAMGTAVLNELRASGRGVPADAGVVVAENPDLPAAGMEAMTAVGRPADRIAAAVIERLNWRWANPDAPHGTVYDPPALVARATTGRVA